MEALKDPRLMKKGAEADIYIGNWFGREAVAKHRIEKKYRVSQLDKALRRTRTVHEAQLLHEAKKAGVSTPTLLFIDQEKTTIMMEFVQGEKIKDNMEKISRKKRLEIFEIIGKEVAKLHNAGIIHGDLTTSNMILTKDGKIVFIDFGLGIRSEKIEDKGVDLHLLKRALQSTHHRWAKECFNKAIEGYRTELGEIVSQDIIKRAQEIEKRGRYAIR